MMYFGFTGNANTSGNQMAAQKQLCISIYELPEQTSPTATGTVD